MVFLITESFGSRTFCVIIRESKVTVSSLESFCKTSLGVSDLLIVVGQ